MTPASKSLLLLGMGWAGKKTAGMDRYIYDYANQLGQHQHQVEFCGLDLPLGLTAQTPIKFTNLASHVDPLLPRLRNIRQAFLKRPCMPVDAVNLHFALYSFPILNDLPQHIPITFTFHGPWFLESQAEDLTAWKTQVQQWLECYVYDRCDRFIVLSKAFGQVLQQHYRVPEEKISVIPAGVNLDWFTPPPSVSNLRTQMNWPQDRFIVFTARRFVKRMGLKPLLTAIDQVRKSHPEVLLAIAGRGYLAETLARQVDELNLNDHVKFLGFLSEESLRQSYQAANLTVVPSQELEGFGLTILESLACGTPVLCTPVGGMQEIVAPLAPDLITGSRNSLDISAHISAILRGEIQPPSPTDCRAYVEKHFNWPTITHQIEDVLFQPRSGRQTPSYSPLCIA